MEATIIAILLALTKGYKGRYTLSRETGLGEGYIRRIYSLLNSQGLIRVTRGGAIITSKGSIFLKERLESLGVQTIKLFEDGLLWGADKWTLIALLRGKVSSVVEARDAVVRNGAVAALIVRRRGKNFYLPGVEEYSIQDELPRLYSILLELPEADGDIIVIVARDILTCVNGLKSCIDLLS